FINDPSKPQQAIDAVSAFKSSPLCPKRRPASSQETTHKWSAFTTLSAISQLQGIQLDTTQVAWSIPDLIKALQTFTPLKVAAAAAQCATEASFFKYFPDQKIDATEFKLDFLTSNDLKEVFGEPKERKDGILKYRENLDRLTLSWRKIPVMSHASMRILTEGLKQNHPFLTPEPPRRQLLQKLDLSENDITDLPDLHVALRDHPSLSNVLVGTGFDPMHFLKSGNRITNAVFGSVDTPTLKLITQLWEYGTPEIESLTINDSESNLLTAHDVPVELGTMLAKLPGLECIQIGSASLIDALTVCVAGNASVHDLKIVVESRGGVAVMDHGVVTETGKKSNKL
ncbi:hypothetical protein HDU99_006656, partial [Rhizoclosmatium hyalinum]